MNLSNHEARYVKEIENLKKRITELEDSTIKANFLWPHEEDSIEEAGYEFANAKTEAYQKYWWGELKERIRNNGR